ncbi:hypothetical protein BCON_0093g00400 [Botryotinia convoluta]|uniref:Uncharacterized protein n=1 Tax=Botryotinia convoluta TaxID=54673 RepID=A0A4Z1IFC6_9HELO|nr:hypothetical protein BCON_0093g00400 [Botryotinia convoluta]
MIALTANASATGSNRKLLEREEITWRKRDAFASNGPQEPTTERVGAHFCNMNGFLDTQFYDGLQETAKMWFETEFGFDLGELGDFGCASTVDLVGEVLGNIFDAIFPEFIWLIETGVKLGEIACDAAETFNLTRLLLRDPETSIVDEKLAKAWAKEIKKKESFRSQNTRSTPDRLEGSKTKRSTESNTTLLSNPNRVVYSQLKIDLQKAFFSFSLKMYNSKI